MVFPNGIFFKCAKCHFSLKGLDFSCCLSVRCDQRHDHSISSRLWLLGVYPKGSPTIAPISAAPNKAWRALLSVLLSGRMFQDPPSLLQWFYPNLFIPPHHMPLEAQPLFLNFLSPDKFPRPFSSLSQTGKGYCLHSNSHYTVCGICPIVWFPTWLGNHGQHYSKFVLASTCNCRESWL